MRLENGGSPSRLRMVASPSSALESPEKIHSISALGNERLSGLELICLMHAAFQRIHAGTEVGVDFSHIWPAAQMMHAARNP